MVDGIRSQSGLNIVRVSEATCGSVPHPLYGDLLVPYVPVCVTRGVFVAHRYAYVPHRC